MFVVTKQTIYECLEKQIFGVNERYKSNIEFITPGTIIFLYDSTDHIVYGAYEALTYPIKNVEPSIYIFLFSFLFSSHFSFLFLFLFLFLFIFSIYIFIFILIYVFQ